MESLTSSVKNGDVWSREKVHHGASIAGMAFGSAFLGVCHSLAHQVSTGGALVTTDGATTARCACPPPLVPW